jgi:hypothetical protein
MPIKYNQEVINLQYNLNDLWEQFLNVIWILKLGLHLQEILINLLHNQTEVSSLNLGLQILEI